MKQTYTYKQSKTQPKQLKKQHCKQHQTETKKPSKEKRPIFVKQNIAEKRKARKRWQLTKAPQGKQRCNKLANELKNLLHNLKN
jgi:hypothetical protein